MGKSIFKQWEQWERQLSCISMASNKTLVLDPPQQDKLFSFREQVRTSNLAIEPFLRDSLYPSSLDTVILSNFISKVRFCIPHDHLSGAARACSTAQRTVRCRRLGPRKLTGDTHSLWSQTSLLTRKHRLFST